MKGSELGTNSSFDGMDGMGRHRAGDVPRADGSATNAPLGGEVVRLVFDTRAPGYLVFGASPGSPRRRESTEGPEKMHPARRLPACCAHRATLQKETGHESVTWTGAGRLEAAMLLWLIEPRAKGFEMIGAWDAVGLSAKRLSEEWFQTQGVKVKAQRVAVHAVNQAGHLVVVEHFESVNKDDVVIALFAALSDEIL